VTSEDTSSSGPDSAGAGGGGYIAGSGLASIVVTNHLPSLDLASWSTTVEVHDLAALYGAPPRR
jgi:hypothetical protein